MSASISKGLLKLYDKKQLIGYYISKITFIKDEICTYVFVPNVEC